MYTSIFRLKNKTVCLFLALVTTFLIIKSIYGILMYKSVPILLWWTPFVEVERVIRCDNYSCLLTSDRVYKNHSRLSAYLFYGSRFNPTDLPIGLKHIPWSIFHEESPKNLGLFLYRDGQSVFNITSTFDQHSDFPVPLQYLRDIESLTSRQYYIPIEKKKNLLKNHAPVLYIQSDCNTPIERDMIVAELMKYIKVDSYGVCLNNKKLPDSLKESDVYSFPYHNLIMQLAASYKFTIAIENARCDDYITEKLWRSLIVGSIPIYLGAPNVGDWLPNNKSAILIGNFESIESLASYIIKVNQDNNLYLNYLDHKEKLNFGHQITNKRLINLLKRGKYGLEGNQEDVVPAFECFVCRNIHTNGFKKQKQETVYSCPEPKSRNSKNPVRWKDHWKRGKCEGKVLKELLEQQKNYSKNDYEYKVDQYYKNNMC